MSPHNIDVSIIVPVYNVEEYLKECLQSLQYQGQVNTEVIMIDDGSTDGSSDIARRYSEKHSNYHYFRVENGGLGRARNIGVQKAHGKYIAFVDSDDEIPKHTHEKMFNLAEKNDAEMVTCNVERYDSKKSWSSSLHEKVFRNYQPVTHIYENNDLINDTISCNKLILREFFINNGFAFPEGILYEDIPVTIPMHIMCNKVVMMREVGYRWRVRDGASKSITQNTSSEKNLTDRIKVIKMLDEFFLNNVTDEKLIRAKQIKYLETDLKIFIEQCANISEDSAYSIIDAINTYIEQSGINTDIKELSLLNRQIYREVKEKNLGKLIKLLEFKDYYNAPVIEKDGRLFVELPNDLFPDADRDITFEFKNRSPRVWIDDIRTIEEGVQIYAHVYWRRFNINIGDQEVKVFLCSNKGRFEIESKEFRSSSLTDNFGKVITNFNNGEKVTEYIYDGAGFSFYVGLDIIDKLKLSDGRYHIELEYKNRLFKGADILAGIDYSLREKFSSHSFMQGSKKLQLDINRSKEISFILSNECLLAEEYGIDEYGLIIRTGKKISNLHAVADDGSKSEDILLAGEDGYYFRLDITQLDEDKLYVFRTFYPESDTAETELLLDASEGAGIAEGPDSIAVFSSFRTKVLRLRVMKKAAFVESFEKKKGGETIVVIDRKTARTAAEEKAESARIITDDNIRGGKVSLSQWHKCVDNKADVSICLDKREVYKDLYAGKRELYVEYLMPDKSTEINRLFSIAGFSISSNKKNYKASIYRSMFATVRMQIDQMWSDRESSKQKREALIESEYPVYMQEPINKRRILFESMWGKNYSCNPQAIYEYIDENYPEYECIWSLNDERTPIKGKAKRVRRNSLKYYYYLATSRFLVNNVNYPDRYEKRAGQIEIQTMHGTPLKTVGLDVADAFPTESSKENYIKKNQRWDYLITQGTFMEERAYSIFRFKKEILKTGYPRTDRLYNIEEDRVSEIKKELGIPQDRKVILYAPTWRVENRFQMELDLKEMGKKLSDEYVLLIRLHHYSTGAYTIPEDKKFIFNLNSYRYVENLYLISDILITDYSSIMFDYALLDRPMVFFTYDIDEYADSLRGMYVDFSTEAPGPLCRTSDEVISAIERIDSYSAQYGERVKQFKDKYLTYEREDSSREVVKEVIKPNKLYHTYYKVSRVIKRAVSRKLK